MSGSASSTEHPSTPPALTRGASDGAEIGWVRALVSGLVILVFGFGVAVYSADWILTDAQRLRRTPREWLATGLFFLVVIGLAWLLRRLQRRRVI